MATADVTVETLEKVQGSENKFYRTYLINEAGTNNFISLTQWGSQRGGRTGGQFKSGLGAGLSTKKLKEKRADGYTDAEPSLVFAANWDAIQKAIQVDDKVLGQSLEQAYLSAKSAATAPTPGWACTDCGEKFASGYALNQHIASKHQSGSGGAPSAPPAVADRLVSLSQRAQEVIGLATTDPIKAHVQLVALREEKAEIELDLRRVDSYIYTIETLVDEAL